MTARGIRREAGAVGLLATFTVLAMLLRLLEWGGGWRRRYAVALRAPHLW